MLIMTFGFDLTIPDKECVLSGSVYEYMAEKQTSREGKLKEVMMYLKYIESMKYSTKNDLHKRFKDTDLIPVDLLSEALPPEILQMESLYRSFTRSFYNGRLKEFCIDLSNLHSQNLVNTRSLQH